MDSGSTGNPPKSSERVGAGLLEADWQVLREVVLSRLSLSWGETQPSTKALREALCEAMEQKHQAFLRARVGHIYVDGCVARMICSTSSATDSSTTLGRASTARSRARAADSLEFTF